MAQIPPKAGGKRRWSVCHGAGKWHSKALLLLSWATAILVAILGCFAAASARGSVTAQPGLALYSGPCGRAKHAHRGLQAALAVVAISLSVCFDFFLRLAAAPTAADLARAHARGRSLRVGVASLHNMRAVEGRRRRGGAALLLLAMAPLQLFLHASAFVVFTETGFSRFVVSRDFVAGGAVAAPGVASMGDGVPTDGVPSGDPTRRALGVPPGLDQYLPSLRAALGRWDRLEARECKRLYFDFGAGLQDHRDVVMVVKADGKVNKAQGWTAAEVWNATSRPAEESPDAVNSLWWFASECFMSRVGRADGSVETRCCPPSYDSKCITGTASSYLNWVADGNGIGVNDLPPATPSELVLRPIWTEHKMNPAFYALPIDYCLSEPYSPPCTLTLSTAVILINLVCILVGCASSALIAYACWASESCQGLEDAIQVFMSNDDMALEMPTPVAPVMRWKEARRRWGHAVSRKTWLCIYVPITLFLIAASALFAWIGVPSLPYDYDFGESVSNRIVALPAARRGAIGAGWLVLYSLVANVPQLAISASYISLSSLYSMLFQAKCWADFSVRPHRLRVSFPDGEQRPARLLQYPLGWGLGFVTLKAALGWLLSQSLYVVPITTMSKWNEVGIGSADSTVYLGYSVKAMLCFLVLSACAASVPIMLGLRSLPPGSLIVGVESAAIAAFCPPAARQGESGDASDTQRDVIAAWGSIWSRRRHLQPLRWGVLRFGSATGESPDVLGLGTEDEVLGLPIDGREYRPVRPLSHLWPAT